MFENKLIGEFNFKVHHNHVGPDSTPRKVSGSFLYRGMNVDESYAGQE
jgi:hypothetical protein